MHRTYQKTLEDVIEAIACIRHRVAKENAGQSTRKLGGPPQQSGGCFDYRSCVMYLSCSFEDSVFLETQLSDSRCHTIDGRMHASAHAGL